MHADGGRVLASQMTDPAKGAVLLELYREWAISSDALVVIAGLSVG